MQRLWRVIVVAFLFSLWLMATCEQMALAMLVAGATGIEADAVDQAVIIGSFVGIGLSPLVSLIVGTIVAGRGGMMSWRLVLWAGGAGAGASMIATYVLLAALRALPFYVFPSAALALGVVPIVAAVLSTSKVIGFFAWPDGAGKGRLGPGE